MSPWFHFALAVFATWRVTHLFVSEDGPADLIVRFRAVFGESWVGKMLDCFYCFSLWIAAPAALFVTRDPFEWLFNWLAVSGAACLLERAFTQTPTALIEPMPPFAQGDINHVLRTETVVTE